MIERLTEKDAAAFSPNILAFYGDSVYETMVRRYIITRHQTNAGRLHELAVEQVRASYQSEAVNVIEPLLDEREADILRRGRNAGACPYRRAQSPPNTAARPLSRRCSAISAYADATTAPRSCSPLSAPP